MTSDQRNLAVLAAVAVVAIVAGFWFVTASGPGTSPGSTPSSGPSQVASAAVASPSAASASSAGASASVAPSATATAKPSAPATPAPTAVPTPTATIAPSPSAVACAVKPAEGQLPSDRVVSVKVATSSTMDFVTFVFEVGSLTPAGPPRGKLTVADPPFTYAGSGQSIDLHGQHALQVRMSNMSLYNDVGEPTFTGDPDIKVDMPALKQVVMYDASEGIAGWFIGYDGNGCVDLVRDGMNVTVTIAHS